MRAAGRSTKTFTKAAKTSYPATQEHSCIQDRPRKTLAVHWSL